ncbi:Establishment of cohesion 1 [Blastocladiella emersonii ATCC 22665]|nr:Establishment of cohesion 1 [Blastocladiella emersonii ATCC 22665]
MDRFVTVSRPKPASPAPSTPAPTSASKPSPSQPPAASSSSSTKPSSSPSSMKPPSKLTTPKAKIQTRLNFGQRGQGVIRCSGCAMYYLPTSESDRKLHDRHHAASLKGIEFPGYRAELLLPDDPELAPATESSSPIRFVLIDPCAKPAPSSALRAKGRAIMDHVDEALGASSLPFDPPDASDSDTELPPWLLVAVQGRFAVGAVVVDRDVKEAWPAQSANDTLPESIPPPSCTVTGVARIWVHPSHGRRGIASRMLGAVCEHVGIGKSARKAALAFSQPTESGWALAKAFIGSPEVLIYL